MIEWGAGYAAAAAKAAARQARASKDGQPSYNKIEQRISEIAGSVSLKEQLKELDFPTDKVASNVGHQSIHNFVTRDDHLFENESYLYSILAWLALDFYPLISLEMDRLKIGDKQRFTVAATELLGLDPSGIASPKKYVGVYRLFRPHTDRPTKQAMACRFTVGGDNDPFACVLEQRFNDKNGRQTSQRAAGRLVPCGERMMAMLQLRIGCPIIFMIDTPHDPEPDEGIRTMSGIMSIMTTNKKACAYPFYAVREESEFQPTEVELADLPEDATEAFRRGVVHWNQQA